MQVISLTKGKIRRDFIAGREIIIKKSSFDEVRKIEEARKLLKKHDLKIAGQIFKFHLPRIYDYHDGHIFMESLPGTNLELALRSKKRLPAVNITNNLFQYLYDQQIFWGDFAPRNVMIDNNQKTINLCDFERGIQNGISGKDFLQNYAYEEYAAFLFPAERKFSESLNHVFTVDRERPVMFDDITSKRVKSIIMEQKLPLTNLTNQTVANINKMIVKAETPYLKDGEPVFPIIELEQIKDLSYQRFAQRIGQIMQFKRMRHVSAGRI